MSTELDRELLQDIGFMYGTGGWGHEVWVYDGMFWIHYGDYDKERWLSSPTAIDSHASRKDFLKQFIEAVRNEVHESYVEYPESY